jgi:hypothetical protein
MQLLTPEWLHADGFLLAGTEDGQVVTSINPKFLLLVLP